MKMLESNDYVVKVFKHGDVIHAEFPARLIKPHIPKTIKKYRIKNGKLFFSQEDERMTYVDVPNYAVPVAVYMDIRQDCQNRRYSEDLVKVGKKYGIKHIWGIMPELDESLSPKCSLLLLQLNQDKPDKNLLEKQGLLEGYNKLKFLR